MWGWPPARTSGLTRTETAGGAPPAETCRAPSSARTSSSACDSTLKRRIPLRFAPARSGIAQSLADFFAGLPYPGKNNPAAVHSDAPKTVEFATGNNVEAAAEPREEAENREIPAGFDGIAERVGKTAQSAMEFPIGGGNGRAAVNISGRAAGFRDALEGNVLAIDLPGAARAAAHRKEGSAGGRVHESPRPIYALSR